MSDELKAIIETALILTMGFWMGWFTYIWLFK